MTSPFDSIRHLEETNEYWIGRELMRFLDYNCWQNFSQAVDRAMISCEVHGEHVADHFSRFFLKTDGRPREDYRLSRYAAYLVAMCSDPRKRSVADAQAYFCVKTRQAELADKALPSVRKVEVVPYGFDYYKTISAPTFPQLPVGYEDRFTPEQGLATVDYSLRLCAYILTRMAGDLSPAMRAHTEQLAALLMHLSTSLVKAAR